MRECFKEVALSDEFKEHFAGLMLGDGCLSNRNKSKHSSQFLLRNKHASYALYVADLFRNEGFDCMVGLSDTKGGFPGSSVASSVYTKFYKTLADLERHWYQTRQDGTHYKIVPADVKITPHVLLQWFIGDGYLVNLRGVPNRVQICTDRYTNDEIVFLRDCFERDTGIPIQIDWTRRRLRVPTRMLRDFFDVLPQCPQAIENDFTYKWAA